MLHKWAAKTRRWGNVSRIVVAGVRVPNGFATTADAYRYFVTTNQLETKIAEVLAH